MLMKKVADLNTLEKSYLIQPFNPTTFSHSYSLPKFPTKKLTGDSTSATFCETSQLCAEPALAAGFFYGG